MKRRYQRKRDVATVTVVARSAAATTGYVHLGPMRLPCALGRSGCRVRKREGDGATPIGRWPVLRVQFRGDRLRRPRTALPVQRSGRTDGWCDAPNDRSYNRPVRHPYAASAERLWREDALYDVVVVLGHNHRPRLRGAGSAIFMHVARPGYLPTEGCLALRRDHLLRLLAHLRPGSLVDVLPRANRQ
ncbi:MAG TPA: L,D-transpeptidase family protein [Hyphomicrobiaceae bacterium]|jgi:L,D-peptidoglycan transpeptidase YkuD (ErfK/YbiS/YcfS/YnhG family)|nr:L,D-transpeptidase family protein [Hyphomicrobiaceae bacterium]